MYLVMVNGIRTKYPCGLNKGFWLKFCAGSQFQYEMPEEGRRMHQPKCCEFNNEDISPNILSDKNYPASSQKFRQIDL